MAKTSKSAATKPPPRARAAKSPGLGRGRPTGQSAPYHHGALRDALLTAAERILERDGLPGLTLRAAAREAGVSHAAPTHHFGDLAGLLSDLAAIGFQRFAATLTQAADRAATAEGRLDAMGRAYVAFARSFPGMFTLMFRSERLDPARPALQDAMKHSAAVLAGAVGAQRADAATASPLAQAAGAVRAWALVHGFAVLLLDGRLAAILSRLPRDVTVEKLLEAVLDPDAA
jgi:AcrR family transcriptional regulator